MINQELIGKSVLIVEDDAKIRELLKIYLLQEGYEVLEAADGLEGKRMIEDYDPCIVLLDLMLPKLNGEELCYWIREEFKSLMPIIMITAKVSEKSKLEGFALGADDYIVKPFSPAEVMSRIAAVLRRTASRCGKLSFTGFLLKPLKGQAFINGQELKLTSFEFKLLHILMQHPNQILTRTQLLDHIYATQEKEVNDRTIDVHIRHLRHKIREQTDYSYILTVRGMGYKFVSS
ncbi:response regulator transcription factor [Exiguobacterium sp. TBG-PICH-001]|uniref:response regulator transcription factor n=1 Tax=Exiguobacterium abrahamii TaxID=2785532 RepID=UPI0018A75043|nr:response regulator transcription factor [Exiguobacterium sp. TBG-PICH-001]MBF8153963.1 response regulator transcription factor [Exiguobacterium sp. TBG-PICH-001]